MCIYGYPWGKKRDYIQGYWVGVLVVVTKFKGNEYLTSLKWKNIPYLAISIALLIHAFPWIWHLRSTEFQTLRKVYYNYLQKNLLMKVDTFIISPNLLHNSFLYYRLPKNNLGFILVCFSYSEYT